MSKSNVRKGKDFERRIANVFTEWTGHKFRRRRIEGRQQEVHALEGGGDVICIDSDFVFNIECKAAKNFSLDSLLQNKSNCVFVKWWHQSCTDASMVSAAKGFSVLPMVVFKPTINTDWVAADKFILTSMKDSYHWAPYLSYNFTSALDSLNNINFPHNKLSSFREIIFIRLKDMLEYIDPKYLFARR